MTLTICSGFSPKGHIEYGQRFLDSFDKHWPKTVNLRVYVEEMVPGPKGRGRVVRSLWAAPGMKEFLDRNGPIAARNGREPAKHWKDGERQRGYSFRWDAVKFSRQCFIPELASKDLPDGDILCWLDADTVSHSDVPEGFIEGLLGAADIVFLGRGRKHSEIGFWAVRLGPGTRRFLADLADIYRTDSVFELGEWHSAFAWDHCRRRLEAEGLIQTKDLTPGGTGHVWFQSPLARHLDHLKGDARKAAGRSSERTRK